MKRLTTLTVALALAQLAAGCGDVGGDITPFVGSWSCELDFLSIGMSTTAELQVEDDGNVSGSVDMPFCVTELSGQAFGDTRGWPFYAELEQSRCTSGALYMGGGLSGGRLKGYFSEQGALSDPPDASYQFVCW